MVSDLSEYEKLRLANIRRNNAVLASLGFEKKLPPRRPQLRQKPRKRVWAAQRPAGSRRSKRLRRLEDAAAAAALPAHRLMIGAAPSPSLVCLVEEEEEEAGEEEDCEEKELEELSSVDYSTLPAGPARRFLKCRTPAIKIDQTLQKYAQQMTTIFCPKINCRSPTLFGHTSGLSSSTTASSKCTSASGPGAYSACPPAPFIAKPHPPATM